MFYIKHIQTTSVNYWYSQNNKQCENNIDVFEMNNYKVLFNFKLIMS